MNLDEKIGNRLPLKIHVFYLLKTTAQGFSLLQIKKRVLFPMLYEVNDLCHLRADHAYKGSGMDSLMCTLPKIRGHKFAQCLLSGMKNQASYLQAIRCC
jgi:hypothetical protein